VTPPASTVRFVVGSEPGDRKALVGLLTRILIDQRRRAREPQLTDAARLAGGGGPTP
jgi:hypothetical protein